MNAAIVCLSLADQSNIRLCIHLYSSRQGDAEIWQYTAMQQPMSEMSGHGCSRSSRLVTPTADPHQCQEQYNGTAWQQVQDLHARCVLSAEPACKRIAMLGHSVFGEICIAMQGAAAFGHNMFGRDDTAVRLVRGEIGPPSMTGGCGHSEGCAHQCCAPPPEAAAACHRCSQCPAAQSWRGFAHPHECLGPVPRCTGTPSPVAQSPKAHQQRGFCICVGLLPYLEQQ